MVIYVLALLGGTCAIQALSYRAALINGIVAVVLLCLAHARPLTWLAAMGKLALIFCLGYSLAYTRIAYIKSQQLPSSLEKQTLQVQGTVQGVPEIYLDRITFLMRITQVTKLSKGLKNMPSKMLAQLTWYGMHSELQPGQKWQLLVSLKRPHGLANPGSYNRELSAIQQRIGAMGYVKHSANNFLLAEKAGIYPIASIRYSLMQKVKAVLHDKQLLGFVSALGIGITYPISYPQWQVLRATGTSHLMAISGLHVSLVVALVYFLVNGIWRRSEFLALKLPAVDAGAGISLLVGAGYSLLAGMSISTQRALIMLSVYLLLQLSKRKTQTGQALSLALLLILLWDPLAYLSAGFWLSFSAVAFILYGTMARYQPTSLWWKYGRVQWVVSMGLLPISLLLFHQASLSALLANFIAVPWVSFAVVPFIMAGIVVLTWLPNLAAFMLNFAAYNLKLLLNFLIILASYKPFLLQQTISNYWVLSCSILACLLLLAPAGFPARGLSVVCMLPLLIMKPAAPKPGEVWLAVLDVGQGLASVIRTRHHTVVYDTGPSYGKEFNMGSAVVIPYLQTLGVKKLDSLIISHGDNDHSGGASAVLQNLPVKRFYTSEPNKFAHYKPIACSSQYKWQWDGVEFEFISPSPHSRYQGNNRSCVLRINQGERQIMLPGDIEKPVEKKLVSQQKNKLKVDILLAPHHGSTSSSSASFIQASQPEFVVFSTGYLNRFGFPNAEVVQRYKKQGSKTFNTASCGMVSFKISSRGTIKACCFREDLVLNN